MGVSGPSDAELIAESIHDPGRFGEVFDRHAQSIFRFLGRRIGADGADDVLGDVFLAAFEQRSRYDQHRTSALPWLYGIASNLMRKHLRRQASELRMQERFANLEPVDDPTDGVATSLDARSRLATTAKFLDELPADERDALLLFAWEELSYDEIAEALGVPVGTVRSRLNRGRQRLRAAMEELDSVRAIRPDRLRPIPDAAPTVLERQKERLMEAIDWNRPGAEDILRTPDVHARLAYRDERAALDHLVRVFRLRGDPRSPYRHRRAHPRLPPHGWRSVHDRPRRL